MSNVLYQMPKGMEGYAQILEGAVKTLKPYPGEAAKVGDIKLVNTFPVSYGANQIIEGEKKILCALLEKNGGLLFAAGNFAGENFRAIDEEDALDAAGELLNYISGSYAADLSMNGTHCELLPPDYGNVDVSYKPKQLCSAEIRSGEKKVDFLIGVLS